MGTEKDGKSFSVEETLFKTFSNIPCDPAAAQHEEAKFSSNFDVLLTSRFRFV